MPLASLTASTVSDPGCALLSDAPWAASATSGVAILSDLIDSSAADGSVVTVSPEVDASAGDASSRLLSSASHLHDV